MSNLNVGVGKSISPGAHSALTQLCIKVHSHQMDTAMKAGRVVR